MELSTTITLTPAQVRCLFAGPWAEGFDLNPNTVKIEQRPDDGWIWLYPADAESWNGVWIDTFGCVYYSPSEECKADFCSVTVTDRTVRSISVKITRG